VAVGIGVFVAMRRGQVPRLNEAEYEAAVKRWEAKGPADYNLDIELGGQRPGKIHVEVRDGQATHMIRDGVEPKQKRTWDYWTVPGMLDTIGQEIETARDPAAAFKSVSRPQVVMWAEFDAQLGYPRQFDRAVLGSDFEVHWKVTNFEDLTGRK